MSVLERILIYTKDAEAMVASISNSSSRPSSN